MNQPAPKPTRTRRQRPLTDAAMKMLRLIHEGMSEAKTAAECGTTRTKLRTVLFSEAGKAYLAELTAGASARLREQEEIAARVAAAEREAHAKLVEVARRARMRVAAEAAGALRESVGAMRSIITSPTSSDADKVRATVALRQLVDEGLPDQVEVGGIPGGQPVAVDLHALARAEVAKVAPVPSVERWTMDGE